MSEENKTKFRLEIDKTIQPVQYEPIKVIVDIEETIVWKDKKDRDKQVRECASKLSTDFVSVFDHVLKKIGEEGRCIGKVSSPDGKISGQVDLDDEFLFD